MKPLDIDSFFDYTFLGGLAFSPDGSAAALSAAKTSEDRKGYDSTLWLTDGKDTKRLTSGGEESSFIWEDGHSIVFSAFRTESEKKRRDEGERFTPFYRIDIFGGEAEKYFEIPLPGASLKVLDSGKYIVTASVREEEAELYNLTEEERKKHAESLTEEKDYETVTETPFWFNSAGFVAGRRKVLYIYDKDTGDLRRLTPADTDVSGYELLDGSILWWGKKGDERWDTGSLMYMTDISTGRSESVRISGKMSVYSVKKAGDRLVALISDPSEYGLNADPSFYELGTDGSLAFIYGPLCAGNSTGSDCRYGSSRMIKAVGDRIYFTETVRNACVLSVLEGNEKRTVFSSEGSVDDFDVSDKGDILMIRLTSTCLQEVYTQDGTKISSFNDAVLKDRYTAKPEKITFNSCGKDIDGWILRPFGYDENERYPAVLDIHGGPKTVYGELFVHEMQYWAGQGYFVFFCNPVGSDGRGDSFSDIRGKYGTEDYTDIMDLTDEVLRRYPAIDPSRVCVTGGSYGGFMTNWIVGHTDRFCCAATQRSISNWLSFRGVSDIGPRFTEDQQAADLFTSPEKLWERSPLKYAENIVTPMLFIHSDADYRCPLEQGVQLFTAVRLRGIEARMVIFHGENHELSRSGRPLHRLRRLREITEWFEKHAK